MKKAIFALLLLFAIYMLAYIIIYKPIDKRYSSFNTLPIVDQSNVSLGYTLISPYTRLLKSESEWKGEIYLIDMLGKPVHTWRTNHQAFYSALEPSGNLVAVMEPRKYSRFFPPGGNTGILQVLDWNSKVLFEYKNEAMHHDFVILPNGNFLISLWEETPKDIVEKIKGGAPGTEIEGTIWSDALVELNREGRIVWTWHSYDHLDPEEDIVNTLLPRFGWTYINGLSYTNKNPIDGTPAYLVSMRSTSTVLIVRKSDGEIIWRSPKGMLSLQHDPTFLFDGNILVFDNGLNRTPDPFPVYGSRVIEINPKTNKVVWSFDGGELAIDKSKLFAPIVGGAQRLSNGNTMITEGVRGHIFEVTKNKEIVWDLVSPYQTRMTGSFPNNFLFKSRRYASDEVKWPEKLSPSLNPYVLPLHRVLSNIYFWQ